MSLHRPSSTIARRLILAVALLIVSATSSWAHDWYRFAGSVTKVDTRYWRVSISSKDEDGQASTVVLYVPDVTAVTKDGKNVAKSTLKVGMWVVVDAVGDGYDDLQATEIKIVPPPVKTK